MRIITDVAIEYEDFQIDAVMNRVEYKEQKNYVMSVLKCRLIDPFYFLKIASPKWSSWRAVYSCNCNRKLTLTSL